MIPSAPAEEIPTEPEERARERSGRLRAAPDFAGSDTPPPLSGLVPRAALRDALSGPAEAFRGAERRSAEPGADTEPTIHVTIGRIEVKAPQQPPPPPARPARQGPRVTLSEYLRRRQEGR